LGRVSESGGETHTGVGDLAIAPRALLVTTDRFLASVSVGVTVPTGDSRRGLGSGETSLGPALSTWGDLGDGLTLQTRIGTGHGLETGDVSLDYHAALIWTLGGADDRDQQQQQQQHHPQHHGATEHLPPGMISLLAEFGGGTVLDGPRMDGSTAEVLLGVGYAWDTQWEVRGAVLLPVVGPSDVDPGVVVEAILHF
jgi:hypothetical protein